MSEPSSTTTPKDRELALWLRLRQQNDDQARLHLIDLYLELAHRIAGRLFIHRPDDSIEFEDYYQYAIVGLIESVDRYQPGGKAAFATFASLRIRGAVLNGIEKANELRQQMGFRARLRRERVNSLTQDRDEDLFTQMIELTTGLAIGYMLEDSGLVDSHKADTEQDLSRQYELRQIYQRLREAIDELPEREKIIIVYHYCHHINFAEIARMLNVSKGRVSQIHKRILQTIRARLGSESAIDSYY